ncbi:alpha/beta fold hydrolase [Anaerococcus hydrogenalis]|uniref:alpha/beta fold hydrolase n=1 Tax=Anaerococcus hydrogenalis TaxID=33029 RepID=UPI00288917A0|nr:alpha/beta fold hydrolase [Anaerococcus hydrogenalis]
MQNDKVKILFLHGLGQNKESFDKTIENINFKDIENIDLIPNNSKDLTFFDIVDMLENKIKGIKKPVIICGISLGAILAMELYFRNPQKIAGLILIAPQYKIPKMLMNFQNLIFKIMPEKFFKKTKISKNNMISIASSIKNLDYRKK